jgi:hypothetical protein
MANPKISSSVVKSGLAFSMVCNSSVLAN